MARANLASLLGNIDDATAPVTLTHLERRETERPKVQVSPQPERHAPDFIPPTPLYLRLMRKEARLREEQYSALTEHARSLTRRRRGTGARITENTLIRIAIDLLLARIDTAAGDDEREILESLL